MQIKYLFILFIIINFYIIFIFLIHSCQNYQLVICFIKTIFHDYDKFLFKIQYF